MIDGGAFDDGIGEGIVIEARRTTPHAGLGFVNLLGGCGIDAPVESENAVGAMGLKVLGFGCGGQDGGLGGTAGEEDQKRDGSVLGAEDGPIGRAAAHEAGLNDVFRAMGFVGLWNEAAAEVEEILDGGWELWEGADGQMADCVWGGAAVEDDLTGLYQWSGTAPLDGKRTLTPAARY